MGGVGDEVLADLFDLVLGGHVADHDTGVGIPVGRVGELGGVDDPGIDAAVFEIAARGGLLGEDDAGLHGLAGVEAAQQGVGEAGVEEGFSNRPVESSRAPKSERAASLAKRMFASESTSRKASPRASSRRLRSSRALFEVEFEAEFPRIDFGLGLFAVATVAIDEEDQCGEGRKGGEDRDGGDHAFAFATQ